MNIAASTRSPMTSPFAMNLSSSFASPERRMVASSDPPARSLDQGDRRPADDRLIVAHHEIIRRLGDEVERAFGLDRELRLEDDVRAPPRAAGAEPVAVQAVVGEDDDHAARRAPAERIGDHHFTALLCAWWYEASSRLAAACSRRAIAIFRCGSAITPEPAMSPSPRMSLRRSATSFAAPSRLAGSQMSIFLGSGRSSCRRTASMTSVALSLRLAS